MKKTIKFLSITLVVAMLAVGLTSCTKKSKPTTSRVTIDINPSIELIVDEKQKVVSVSALNDDGAIIIAGEEIVGKDVEDATKIIVYVCTETGYIVKTDDTIDSNNVKISVSGDTSYAKKLAEKVKTAAKDYFDDNHIKAHVEQINALTVEELRTLVLNNSTFTQEQVDSMTEEDLLKALSVSRIETALLISEEMKKMYFEAKEYEISFAEKEETAKIIQQLGTVYSVVSIAYMTAVEQYRSAVDALENLKYNTLISPESSYQKALVAMREAKVNYVEQRSYVANLEAGELKVSAEIKLSNLKNEYERLEKAYVDAGNAAIKSFDTLINALRKVESKFVEVEELIKSFNLEETLTQNAKEIEAAVNLAKDQFFAKFEETHKEDIEKGLASLIEKKEALKNSILNKDGIEE